MSGDEEVVVEGSKTEEAESGVNEKEESREEGRESSGWSVEEEEEGGEAGSAEVEEDERKKSGEGRRGSEESVVKRESMSPTDLKRVKWEEVDLLFLDTETGAPFRYRPTFECEASYESGVAHLDFSFVRGDISKREYDYFMEKYQVFAKMYQNQLQLLNRLIDDNAIYEATLRDHKVIGEWFESMPDTIESKSEAVVSKDKEQLYDIRKDRMNAIAYRLLLSELSERGEKWTKEAERMGQDKEFLVEEIKKFSPDSRALYGPKQIIANLALDLYTLDEEITEVMGKIKNVDDFTHGFVARNEVLETRLGQLEMEHASERKELADLRLETERMSKTRNELRSKVQENQKCLEGLEEEKRGLMKQFEKLQSESARLNRIGKSMGKQMEATGTETQLWEVRSVRTRERSEKARGKIKDLNDEMERSRQDLKKVEKEVVRERAVLEKSANKCRQLEKALAALQAENEGEKNKINMLKESGKNKIEPAAVENERKKLEKEIDGLRKEIINLSRLQGFERQEYIRVYGELKRLQQNQWAVRKIYQDNVGKIRKACMERSRESDNIQRLSAEMEKQKLNIKWVKQQKVADEKLLAKKNAELRKILAEYKNERLEKSKDLQERKLRIRSIGEWKEINRVGDIEKEELDSLKMQLVSKTEDLVKNRLLVLDSIQQIKETYKETKSELGRSKMEYEALQTGIKNVKVELYKRQLANEEVTRKYIEAAADRNYKSTKLDDAIREEAYYTEHVSTTQHMMWRADLELVARLDVVSRLRSIRKMELLGMDKLRQKLESWSDILQYLDDLAARFQRVTAKQIELQKKFDGSRHRMVRDKRDEDPSRILRAYQILQDRVQAKQEKVMELKLLNYQTGKLLDKMRDIKRDKIQLVQSTNNAFVDSMRKNIGAEKKSKQFTMELSLKKSLAETLKAQLVHAKMLLGEASDRLEKGQTPTPDMEAEWRRTHRKQDTSRIRSFSHGESTNFADNDLGRAVTVFGYRPFQ